MELARKDAHGNRDGDVLGVEKRKLVFLRIPVKIATHSGGIVATHSGMIVAIHSGASLPRFNRSVATLAFMT